MLKNALDHGSRPYGKNSWAKKPAGVIGASIGAAGTAVATSATVGTHATRGARSAVTAVATRPAGHVTERPAVPAGTALAAPEPA